MLVIMIIIYDYNYSELHSSRRVTIKMLLLANIKELQLRCCYSGTPLRWTLLGPKVSSFIARCPLLRGYVLNVQELIHCALSRIYRRGDNHCIITMINLSRSPKLPCLPYTAHACGD